ncbi:MAG: hypothetical protein E7031_03335 [Akkermansiaceae bacterium]|nr:hypothetical protein [Akkermansiaceae bacterium]
MSKTEYTGHPDARRPKKTPLSWIIFALLAIIVICCNYIGCREYGRIDLSEYESYSISERSKKLLESDAIQKRETPIRIIFAFPASSPGYHRMYVLLEEYARHSNGKIEIECFDPLRQPGRAHDIEDIYNVKCDQELCIIDARNDKNAPTNHYDADPSKANQFRIITGSQFLKYDIRPDGKRQVVALMMDDVLCDELIKAIEGRQRKMCIITNKSSLQFDNKGNLDTTTISTIRSIVGSLNINLIPAVLSETEEQEIPDDIDGLIIIAPQSDFEPCQIKTIEKFWDRNERKSIFIALDPSLPFYSTQKIKDKDAKGDDIVKDVFGPTLPNLYGFLSRNGIKPSGDDRIMLKNSQRLVNNISVVFPNNALPCTQSFWNNTTQLEGRCRSFYLVHQDESEASARKLVQYPLIYTTDEYYGETNPNRGAAYNEHDDINGPLCVAAAVTKGTVNDPNRMNTLVVVGNVDMLAEEGARKEIRDYLRSVWAWMTERPEYAGKSANIDLTVKIDLNRHSRSAVEHLTLIIMPLLALLIAIFIWNTRRH